MSKRQARKQRQRFAIIGHGYDGDGQPNRSRLGTISAYSAKQALFLFDQKTGAGQLSCVWNRLTAVEEVLFDIFQDTGTDPRSHVMTISAPDADMALELFAKRLGYKLSTIKEQFIAQPVKK